MEPHVQLKGPYLKRGSNLVLPDQLASILPTELLGLCLIMNIYYIRLCIVKPVYLVVAECLFSFCLFDIYIYFCLNCLVKQA